MICLCGHTYKAFTATQPPSVRPHISFRDVSFHASTTGVKITVTTDIPCHLYCRLSEKQPWIHKKPTYRRGIFFNWDVRFCFTVFEDNEQYESGDTLIHTWWKENWPVCTTKYCYFWGTVNGQTSPSTSPLFKYHNDGFEPIPPPEPMYQLNPIDPQFYTFPGGSSWTLADLSRDIPQDATGALIVFYNADTGAEQPLALRKPGASYDSYQPMQRDGILWAIVGLDSQRRFEYRFGKPGYLHGYLMAYTGRDVVFPDDPIDIKPTIDNAYHTVNIKEHWPEAQLILTDLGSWQSWNTHHSIRPYGSSKEIYHGAYRCFPFSALSEDGRIQTKLYRAGGPSTQWLAYAYFKKDTTTSLNGIDLEGFTANAWKTLDCGTLNPDARFAFLEYYHPFSAVHISARKRFSYFNYTGRNANHGYIITHLHHNLECEVYSGNTMETDQLLFIAETH